MDLYSTRLVDCTVYTLASLYLYMCFAFGWSVILEIRFFQLHIVWAPPPADYFSQSMVVD